MPEFLAALIAALLVGAISTAGSFALAKWLLVKKLEGPWGSLIAIRRLMGVLVVGDEVLYSGSFASKLLRCHNCLSPYAAALVTALVAMATRTPLGPAAAGYILAVGGTITLFDYLDTDYD